jgi:hypothetical protein
MKKMTTWMMKIQGIFKEFSPATNNQHPFSTFHQYELNASSLLHLLLLEE